MSKTEWDLCVFTDNPIRWNVNQQLLFKASSTSIGSQRGGLDSTTFSSDFVVHSFDFFSLYFGPTGHAVPSPELFAETKPLESECLCYTDARTEIESMAFCQRPRPPHSLPFGPVHRDLCSLLASTHRYHPMKYSQICYSLDSVSMATVC